MNPILLEKYAEFAVKTAVNLQKEQTLHINSPIDTAFFARALAQAGYDAGAKEVVVHYNDEKMGRIKLEHTALEVLEDVKEWQLKSYLDYNKTEGDICVISILAQDPEIYKGLDTEKIEKASQATQKAMEPFRELSMSNRIQWCVLSVPNEAWAQKIFPQLNGAEAVEALWDTIFAVSRVQNGQPVEEWKAHVNQLNTYSKRLQALALTSLRFTSANGTDLEVGLADDHVWLCAEEHSSKGIPFLANVPTEEIFTAPHCMRTNGVVKSSLPYVYNGNVIEGMSVTFKDGLVVDYSAEKGADLLGNLFSSDEGAKRLGEVALVPASNPIRKTGLLFYNTLFDENAACHIAFGAGYPTTVAGGADMSREELYEKGVNKSLIHEDIMIGTTDMKIMGTSKEGQQILIFENGEWAL